MSTFSFHLATLIDDKATKSKNYKELVEFSHSMGFHVVVTPVANGRDILHVGKRETALLEVTDLLIALHMFATQRHQDLILVGKIDDHKFTHRLFGTLSIEKLRNWSANLQEIMQKRTAA